MENSKIELYACFYDTLYARINKTFTPSQLMALYDILQDNYTKLLALKYSKKDHQDRVSALDKMLTIIHSILVEKGCFKATPLTSGDSSKVIKED